MWFGYKPEFIETSNTTFCPYCKSEDIYSGSWANERCRNCGATYFFNGWYEPGHIYDDSE